GLVLFTAAGMMMVVHASHLLMLLIGIETMSLAAYVLTGCWRRNARSSEGALKYFLMGAFATGFLVYGSALVYGTTGGAMTYAGHLLLGLPAMGYGIQGAQSAILFYLAVYTFTTLGTFGVVAWVGRRGDERLFIDDWAGLGNARPGLALAMTIFLLSLGGVPPTGGFFGKFYLFRTAMEDPRLYWLVIAGVLNSVVSIYYYLRVVVAMYFRDPVRPHEPFPSASMRVALVIAVVAVVALGVFPGAVLDWAGGAVNADAQVAGV